MLIDTLEAFCMDQPTGKLFGKKQLDLAAAQNSPMLLHYENVKYEVIIHLSWVTVEHMEMLHSSHFPNCVWW